MGNMIMVDHLLAALKAEGINTETDKFKRAFRKAQNPAGCEHCGANTKVAIPENANDPDGPHKLACCGKKVF